MSGADGVKRGERTMIAPARLSYAVLAATIILAGLLHLGVPLLVVLFSYFALRQLYFLTKRKWLALILFGIVVAGIGTAAVFFTRAAILALPDVADTSLPSASAWAQKRQIELPFSDFESLRQAVIDTLGQEAHYLRNVANFAKSTTAILFFSILGIIAAGSLFFKTGLDPYRGTHRVKNNLYSICCDEVSTLVFLVLIHKLEYFLNSKIIGDRIRNPIWLTLIALIIGERLMGIPGLILAPAVLNYLRVEMLTVEVPALEKVEALNR